MRNYLVMLALVLATATTAFGQRRGELPSFKGTVSDKISPEEVTAARRKAAGIQDVQRFGAAAEPKKKPFPWMAIGLVALVALATVPFARKMVKSTRRDLEDQATFGITKGREESSGESASPRTSRRPPARSAQAAANETRIVEVEAVQRSPRDAIWDVIATSGAWMHADEIAAGARLGDSEAADELAALVSEGYLQENRDRAGKPIFKVVA